VFFAVAMMHSWSLWYFLGGGLILWFIDRLIRFNRGTRNFALSLGSLDNGEITTISLKAADFQYQAGQYCFLNVPGISSLQWHPFSISSAPGDEVMTFHIKNMGPKTWTGKLSAKVTQMKYFGTGQNPSICVDGPYGMPPSLLGRNSIVLIAGGIGITPVISIFRDLHNNVSMYSRRTSVLNSVQTNDLPPVGRYDFPRLVMLVWVARDTEMVKAFKDQLDLILSTTTPKTKFIVHIFITRAPLSDEKMEEYVNFNLQTGRPDLHNELMHLRNSSKKVSQLVFVCGPKPLVKSAQEAAYVHKFEFHSETFEL